MNDRMSSNSAHWEHIIIGWWVHLTPIVLTFAAIILGVRLIWGKRWRSRMSRASFFLLASYAILMIRVLSGAYNPDDGDSAPLPVFAILYLWASVYFLYALVLEWFFPFLIWCKRRNAETDDKIPEQIGGTFDV